MSAERVSDLGEFGVIDRLLAALPVEARAAQADVLVAAGDDAAVMQMPSGRVQIVTADALVEGIHFRLDWTDWGSLGHKALAVNISDVAAMGGTPSVAVVTLGLRGDELVADLESMYRGMGELARRHGVVIVGGDIVRVATERLVAITVIGHAGRDQLMVRSAALAGDAIGVTGTIGAAAAGFEILRDPERFAHSATAPRLVRSHLRPEPRGDAARLLVEHGVRAAMDLSDGLAGDLPKMLSASGVSAEIEEDRLPVIAAVRALFPGRWVDLGLRGGEDYELLFTIPADRWDALERDAASQAITVTRIGTILESGVRPELYLLRRSGERERLPVGAFDHFG